MVCCAALKKLMEFPLNFIMYNTAQMDSSQLFPLITASLIFGFLFGFEMGLRCDIRVKVNYHPRPDDWNEKNTP
jgi:hypothetical protein